MQIKLKYRKEYMQGGFGGSVPAPPKPPAPPTKDVAATNLLTQGAKKPVLGFDSTNKGNNNSSKTQVKTLLGE